MESLLLSSTFPLGSKCGKEKKKHKLTILQFILVGLILFKMSFIIRNQQNLIIRYHGWHPWHVWECFHRMLSENALLIWAHLSYKNLNSPWERLEASDPSQLCGSANLNLELSLDSANTIAFSRMYRKQGSLLNSI